MTKKRSLRFAVSGLLLASAPIIGCKDETPVNEPYPEHTINEPAQPDPVPPTVNEPPQPHPTPNEPVHEVNTNEPAPPTPPGANEPAPSM
jgi:hypothetical protein